MHLLQAVRRLRQPCREPLFLEQGTSVRAGLPILQVPAHTGGCKEHSNTTGAIVMSSTPRPRVPVQLTMDRAVYIQRWVCFLHAAFVSRGDPQDALESFNS
jgi:hypothetical protein